ncbi:MAG: chorismate mutase [Salibacteraceae bacterium]
MNTLNLSGLKSPILIAGPCSAESPEQLHQVASELEAKSNITLFRAGVWKPRTKPNSFEGIGKEALGWLAEIQTKFQVPVITEVATAQHAEAALQNGINHIWIGARTTVNPFSVQEIVEALKGSDVAVMVKNPIHADINLWEGSLERFYQAGFTNLAAIHRGFSSFMKSEYRNIPMWNLPIELKRRMPELPIICDPSHIGGTKELVPRVAQKALDLNMSGLMVEVHPNPEKALSDPQQQLTPSEFIELVNGLIVKQEVPDNPYLVDQLDELRVQIDKIDEDLLSTLASRFSLIQKIGEHKLENNIAVLQIERWNEILKSRSVLGNEFLIRPEFVKAMMELVHQESIKIQTDVNVKGRKE